MAILDDLNANTAALREQTDILERSSEARNRSRVALGRLERERGELCQRDVAVIRGGVAVFTGKLYQALADRALQPLHADEVVLATEDHREQAAVFRADPHQRSRLLNAARQLGREIDELRALQFAGVDVAADLAPLMERHAAVLAALKTAPTPASAPVPTPAALTPEPNSAIPAAGG